MPLDPVSRSFFERRLGLDLGHVRIHVDDVASDSAHAVSALAYTVDRHIVFARGQYDPRSEAGRKLLAHELIHVVQQTGGSMFSGAGRGHELMLEQEADRAGDQISAGGWVHSLSSYGVLAPQRKENDDEPPDATISANLYNFNFVPKSGSTFHAGPKYPQILGMVLKALVDKNYTAEFRDKVSAEITSKISRPVFNAPAGGSYTAEDYSGPTMKEGEPFQRATARPGPMRQLMAACEKAGVTVKLPPELEELLLMAETAEFAYNSLPLGQYRWFSEPLFDAVMASRAKALKDLAAARRIPGEAGKDATELAVDNILASIALALDTIEEIRTDTSLVKHDVYQSMWPTARTKGANPDNPPVAAEDRKPDVRVAAGLIAYSDARPQLTEEAQLSSVGRKKLLDSYAVAQAYRTGGDGLHGNQKLTDYPTQYTADPYPATLAIYPQLDGNLYGSTRAEYGFEMSVKFPDLFAAFQSHHYEFKKFRVPDDKLSSANKALKGSGTRSSHYAMFKKRIAQDERYHEADVRAYANSLWEQMGAPSVSMTAVNLNSAAREFGDAVGTIVETLMDPQYTARFSFDDEGLYIVQAVAEHIPDGEVIMRRPPSAAYMPLFARDPGILAESHLEGAIDEMNQAADRIKEIDKELAATKDSKKKEELEEDRKKAVAIAGGVEGMLSYQRDKFSGGSSEDQKRADHLQDILNNRKTRGFGPNSERLPTVYVSDAGQILDLLIEVRVVSQHDDGTAEYEVNDATTPSSTHATASGKRPEAIVAALEDLFKHSDYGRGKASVRLDGALKSIDVPTLSEGKLFMEAAAHTATLLTVIAIALAPFTAGASMALMVPAMVIGAVPSAYNIIHRAIDHTLHFDMALAMDVVNVVGAAVGVGAETRAGMEAIRLGTAAGKVLIVTGLGVMGTSVLMMSEGALEQMDAIRDMPEGLQKAELAKILGGLMFNAGIMVGQFLGAKFRAEAEAPRTFDEWFKALEEPTREKLENTREEATPGKNLWKRYSEMDPAVRDLLTQCGSDCIPTDPPPTAEQEARIKKLLSRLSPRAKRTLKGLLHDNRAPAAMDAVLDGLEASAAKLKGKTTKGKGRQAARNEAAILERGTGADYILANFSDEAVDALDPANPGKWKRARALADEIAEAGTLDMEAVGAALDQVRQTKRADPEEILDHLKRLSDVAGKIQGVDRLLGPEGLTGPFKKVKGARWTLRFLTEGNLWEKVASFEESAPDSVLERVIDVRLTDGTRIELKSWEEWVNVAEQKTTRQLMADWIPTNGYRDPIVWAFEPGPRIGTAADIIAKMSEALDKALAEKWRGYEDDFAARRVQAIKDKLPSIVRVGTK
ncbi:DUF4157 domain-containing protein [Terriglobus sp. TAA 43]|uniref:eCIS core domain-containing protein n=1 Tax=Terriglobus sp. TAA 43 TaxID=278961 RepID=UPI00068E10B2|nr:DUF4157 domain-containing protein [Terriglobus sp. TAA 43]